jgi:phosphoribosyl 1,2-cyclic phosphodiesterase
MNAKVWGCRGSLAAPGPDTVVYGGNTSCVELVLSAGARVVLDAGTGIRLLGLELAATAERINLCLTHLHLDHLEGLGFFIPLWQPDRELHIWGPGSPVDTLEERIGRYLSPPLFPVQLSEVPAKLTFHDVPDGEFELGSARVRAEPVSHRGPTVGYRFEDGGCVLAYIPDHEPYLGVEPNVAEPDWISGFSLAERADVLMHDSQYFEHEYPNHVGWGHSSVAHAVSFAQLADCRRLILFHHDPLHTDDQLQSLEDRARELWGPEGEPPELAREKTTVQVRRTPRVTTPP